MRRNSVIPDTRPLRWAVTAFALLGALVFLSGRSVRTATVSILDPVVDATVAQSPALRAALTAPTGKRSRLVRVNLAPLPTPGTRARLLEDDLELELFPDLTVKAVFDRFDTIGGSGTWVGHVDEVPMSSVTLAYRDGLLTANINTRDAIYQILPAPEQVSGSDGERPVHIVSEIDPASLPSGVDALEPPPDRQADSAYVPENLADAGDVIDLMVVYTTAAMNQAGGPAGMANMIALGVSDTNSAYANSGIHQRVRLVHTELVPYSDAPGVIPSLTNLTFGSGGLSGIAALRDAHRADLVSLVIRREPTDPACGVAWLSALPGLGSNWGFSVLGGPECFSPAVYVLPHELGHNMGARHDWYVDAEQTPAPWAHGHVSPAGRWRTIMAYNDMCRDQGFSCPVLNYYSTPDVEYIPFCSGRTFNCDLLRYWFFPGTRLGAPESEGTNCRRGVIPSTACAADVRRVLNDTAFTVANYRQSR